MNSSPRCFLTIKENTQPHSDLYIDAYGGFIPNSPQLEQSPQSTYKQMNKLCVGHKLTIKMNKRLTCATIWMHSKTIVLEKEGRCKEYILCNSIYMKSRNDKCLVPGIRVCLELGRRE